MEIFFAFVGIITAFGLLDVAALKWGKNSVNCHFTNCDPAHRPNW